MRVVVAVKSVPGMGAKVEIAKERDRLVFQGGSLLLGEGDDTAIEMAAQLKERDGSEVIVLTVGTPSAQHVLYLGLAKGADRAIRVDANPADSAMAAVIAADAIKMLDCQLLLTGMESDDEMAGRFGATLATLLDVPFAYGVTAIHDHPGDDGTVEITREIGGGVKQVMRLSLPALLAIQPGATPVGYVSIRKLMQVRAKPIESITPLAEVSSGRGRAPTIVDLFPTPATCNVKLVQGALPDVAAELIKTIRAGIA